MTKHEKSSKPVCEEHLLVLKPLKSDCHFKSEVKIDFCEVNNSKRVRKPQMKNHKAVNHVVFNIDKNYSTPSFILNFEQEYYIHTFQDLKREHDFRMRDYNEEVDEIEIAKPKSRSKVCNVCKENYEDYLEHIQSDQHKKNIRSSKFEAYIQELTGFGKRERLKKNLSTRSQNSIMWDERDINEIQSLSKRINKATNQTLHSKSQQNINGRPQKLEQLSNSHLTNLLLINWEILRRLFMQGHQINPFYENQYTRAMREQRFLEYTRQSESKQKADIYNYDIRHDYDAKYRHFSGLQGFDKFLNPAVHFNAENMLMTSVLERKMTKSVSCQINQKQIIETIKQNSDNREISRNQENPSDERTFKRSMPLEEELDEMSRPKKNLKRCGYRMIAV